VIHQTLVGEEIHSEHGGNPTHIGHWAGEEMPSVWIGLPGLRVMGENLRAIPLRVEGNRK